ncbi:OLC1v1006048C1 [Oldenlandia corymbosa var. corymbosa]|nr:OLC1v1006048C1 [Oldenlandia corymbosa var. corymbosa]
MNLGRASAEAASSLAYGRLVSNVVNEVKQSNGEVILFLDELHMLDGKATYIMKNHLAQGDLKCIGATTPKGYRKFIAENPALQRTFQVVRVPEPSVGETIEILRGLKSKFEVHYSVVYSDDALITAAELSNQCISDAYFPNKALAVMDEAGASVRCYGGGNNANEENEQHCGGEQPVNGGLVSSDNVVSCEVIKQVISSRVGTPIEKVPEDKSFQLLDMERVFGKKIIGQDEAIQAVAKKAVRRARVGLSNPDGPIATFLFTGPTGVGKTQLAKLLAMEYYRSNESMVRLDMSEYMEKHSVARLFGSPPGYVGYREGGQLTEPIRKKPRSLILFDEIEKAYVDVFNALLQVLDDGRLTDGKGQVVDFKSTIIIMTSNAGFHHSSSSEDQGYVSTELKRIFRPEFLNRIDEIVVFKSLTKVELTKIVEIMLAEVCERLVQKNNITVEVSMGFKEKLISESGCEEANNYGARPLRRAITKNLEEKLAESILNGEVREGDSVVVDVNSEGNLVLSRKRNKH